MSTSEPFTPHNSDDELDAQPGAETADDELSLNKKALGDASLRSPTADDQPTADKLEDRI
jgi:hypothetical protein